MASSDPAPITLHFQDLVRVAGETIAGSVDLDVALAQENHIEHLRIKFRGSISTHINVGSPPTNTIQRQTVPLIHTNTSLWTQGTAFPEAGSHVLSFPFQCQLPENLPPSFHCDSNSHGGVITYSLEVVGDRSGIFRMNTRIRRVFSVVTAASQNQLVAKESLRQGWDGAWTDIAREDKIRQGLEGDYSRVSASLTLPDLSSFPIATPIPYSFRITTETKTLDRSDRPEDKHAKPLFPAPPTHSAKLKQTLSRHTEIRVRKEVQNVRETFDLQGIRHKADTWNARGVEAVVDEPEWVPKEDKGRGFWRRTVHFSSTLALPFAPTFKTEILDWAYSLHFVVPFPGIGNDLKLQLPIHLGPGSACPPPPIGAPGSSSLTYADVLPAGPPPMIDLPPAYWSGAAHDWDEKS